MGDLRLRTNSPGPAIPHADIAPRITRFGRVLRSVTFFLVYSVYLTTIVGLGQRLLIWPAIHLAPRRRLPIVGRWLRRHARGTLALARAIANVRVSARGAVPPESCIVVMNHQSVLDIPVAFTLVPGPCPVIPTRDRYRRGIPGISPVMRLANYPFVSQKGAPSRAELAALTRAADDVARGEISLIIFPEGHRTRDGSIGRFMRTGLRLILPRARRPVYCIVADGMVQTRTTADALLHFAGTNVRATILGPFPPPDEASVDEFIDSLHARMTAALAQLRSPSVQQSASAAAAIPAR
jgi:1-acyl-sn-glycerol-3-phosphate acyltransferase